MHLLQKTNTLLFIAVIACVIASFLFSGHIVSAVDPLSEACQGPGAGSGVCSGGAENPLFGPTGIITRVTNVVSIVTGMVAIIVIVLAGFVYTRSGGNSAQLQQARDTIIYAGVALVVAALAQAIVRFVLSTLR